MVDKKFKLSYTNLDGVSVSGLLYTGDSLSSVANQLNVNLNPLLFGESVSLTTDNGYSAIINVIEGKKYEIRYHTTASSYTLVRHFSDIVHKGLEKMLNSFINDTGDEPLTICTRNSDIQNPDYIVIDDYVFGRDDKGNLEGAMRASRSSNNIYLLSGPHELVLNISYKGFVTVAHSVISDGKRNVTFADKYIVENSSKTIQSIVNIAFEKRDFLYMISDVIQYLKKTSFETMDYEQRRKALSKKIKGLYDIQGDSIIHVLKRLRGMSDLLTELISSSNKISEEELISFAEVKFGERYMSIFEDFFYYTGVRLTRTTIKGNHYCKDTISFFDASTKDTRRLILAINRVLSIYNGIDKRSYLLSINKNIVPILIHSIGKLYRYGYAEIAVETLTDGLQGYIIGLDSVMTSSTVLFDSYYALGKDVEKEFSKLKGERYYRFYMRVMCAARELDTLGFICSEYKINIKWKLDTVKEIQESLDTSEILLGGYPPHICNNGVGMSNPDDIIPLLNIPQLRVMTRHDTVNDAMLYMLNSSNSDTLYELCDINNPDCYESIDAMNEMWNIDVLSKRTLVFYTELISSRVYICIDNATIFVEKSKSEFRLKGHYGYNQDSKELAAHIHDYVLNDNNKTIDALVRCIIKYILSND